MPEKKGTAATVTVSSVDVARLVAGNGVTFFVTFNKTNRACGVSIGREHSSDDFVVSFDAIRAFAKLLNKHTGKGA